MKSNLLLQTAGILLASVMLSFSQATLQFTTNIFESVESDGCVRLTVHRSGDTSSVVSVNYATANGTAQAGSDYVATNGTLTFAAGEISQTIAVAIVNDGLVELAAQESLSVTLSNPTNGVLGSVTFAYARITDNDRPMVLEFGYYWVKEDEGCVLIGVTRGDDGDFPTSVNFATSDLSATNGVDYLATNGTCLFAAGEKLNLITIPILNDGLKEPNRTFRFTLSNPTNQVLGTQKAATVMITDNDPGVGFTRVENWVHENEGSLVLTVSRGDDTLLVPFTVDFTTTNLSAIAGVDYVATNGTLNFGAGEMTKSFLVRIQDDGVVEPDKQFQVLLSNPTGGLALGATTNNTATVTICDVSEMTPHRFDRIDFAPGGIVLLTLGGGYTPGVGLSNRFEPFLDTYPLEVSTNLVDWTPLAWLARTNAATNLLCFVDPAASGVAQRYYRTPTGIFTTPQRPPSGPHAVGFVDRTLTDTTRRNRYHVSTNNTFPITLWYPAERVTGHCPGVFDREPIARDVRPATWPGFVDRAAYFHGYSVSNAPFATGLGRLPVVLWSHGHMAYRIDGLEWAENLASHGYVVVGIDHADSSLPVYPDGTYLYRNYQTDTVGRELNSTLLQDRLRDCAVVLDVLAAWDQSDSLFAGHLESTNVAALGFSLGGPTAGEFCRVDSRCVAAIGFDAGGSSAAPGLQTAGLQKPSLQMNAWMHDAQTLFSKATTNAYWFQIQNTEHASFSTWYWIVESTSPANRRETARTIADWTLWFLNRYLKGSPAPMPVTNDYPQIFNFQQK